MANTNRDEEAALLASLGSITACASTYESSILRSAKLRAAPQIELPHANIARTVARATGGATKMSTTAAQLIPCGDFGPSLPDLSSMAAPSSASLSSVPHVLRVLSKVRRAVHHARQQLPSQEEEANSRKKRTVDLLNMKEQLCLSYLRNVAGVTDEDGIIPSKNQYRNSDSDGVGMDDVGEHYYGFAASAVAIRTKSDKGSNSDDLYDVKHAAATNRLDQIKNGHQFHQDSAISNNKVRKRNTIMSLKSQMRINNGLTPLKSMEEELYDAEQSRKRREERRKRRLRRRRELLGLSFVVGDDDDCGGGIEEEEETEFVVEDEDDNKDDKLDRKRPARTGILKKEGKSDTTTSAEEKKEEEEEEEEERDKLLASTTKKNGVKWARFSSVDNDNAATSISAKQQHKQQQRRYQTKVFCPVCNSILIFKKENDFEEGRGDDCDNDTPDAFLSRHIAKCQTPNGSGGRKRNPRRTATKRVVDYDEDEDEIECFDYDISNKSTTKKEEEEEEEKEKVDMNSKLDYNETSSLSGEEGKLESVYNPTAVDDLDEYDYEDRTDYWAKYGSKQMNKMAEQDSAEIPPGVETYEGGLEIPAWLNNRLFPYQRIGLRWMWELHCQGAGGVVGDEMGLGKTVQVSSFLGALAANRFLDSVLVVAPTTMLAHWLSELSIWAPGLRRIMIHRSGESDGASRVISTGLLRSLQKWLKNARSDRVNEAIDEEDYHKNGPDAFCGSGYAIVTTYESIRRSPDVWVSHNWSYVVLDEGQKIRNPDADVTLACKRLRTRHRLLLSGTPIQNDLRELWSLFDFIFPGRLGTLPAFEAEFAVPIKRGGYSNASPMQVQLAYRCSLVLRDLINPYLLRRQKKHIKEVHRMPGKTEQVLFCRLSQKQRRMYEEFLRSDEVMGVMRGSANLLGAVTTLRKICNHTDLVIGPDGTMNPSLNDNDNSFSEDDFYEEDGVIADQSGKLKVLSKILPLWKEQGHKVIIFTQWRKMLDIIERFTNTQGWNYARLDGNTNVASRQRLVDRFNNDDSYFCMLMTTRTGGVGLNITGANRVLLYDPDWNPQTDAQARERAWRFGQKRDVTVYRLITAGTIEEKIYQRQIFKTALSNQVLQDPKQRRLFSQKDLKDLFTLKADTQDITETGEITRGKGFVDINRPDSVDASEDNVEELPENSNTLEVVMKSKGLCGVFDHDFVENSSAKKPISVVEMEDDAKKVALKAAASLQESTKNLDIFMPTWTGSDETKQPNQRTENSFGNSPSDASRKMTSSSALLANLQQKRMQIASRGQTEMIESDAESKRYSELLVRLRKFLRQRSSNGGGPTTRELLKEFSDIPDSDAAVFRKMLKSIAVVQNGQWIT